MEELAGMRYKIINQMVKTFIEQEKKFFGTCFSLINNFYNGMLILERPLPYQKTTYDPMKYIRANKIMEGVDANSLPQIKMKDKYSLNNFKSSNIQRNNNMLNNNNNEIINKKYSFEDYKLRKSNMPNNNNINNNQNKVNNITTINNNIQNDNSNNVNPFSYEAYKRRTQSLDVLKRSSHQNNNNNGNTNFYQSNLNAVMSSIINKEDMEKLNPFKNNNNDDDSNPYQVKENPYAALHPPKTGPV